MDFITQNSKIIITLSFLVIGLILLLFSIYYYLKAKKSVNWPTTEGTILTSNVLKETSNTSDNNRSTLYKAEICYSYNVMAQKYLSDKISFMPTYSTTSSKLAYVETTKYPVNTKVFIYYNPANPKEAVIEPGVKNSHIIFLLFSTLIFTIPTIMLLYFMTTK